MANCAKCAEELDMAINVTLVVVGGDVKTTEITPRLPAVLGRGRGATILLPHPLVSRQHCELFEANGKLMVKDLGSLNGTYVGQDKVTECDLPPGSLLTVGSVTFRAVYDANGAPGPGPNDTALGLGTVPAPSAPAAAAPASPAAATVDFKETVRQPAGEPNFANIGGDEQASEEAADAEDDFQAFLKGLGDK
jgi:hypothetical protein